MFSVNSTFRREKPENRMKLIIILLSIFAVLSSATAESVIPTGIFQDLFANFSSQIDDIPEVILSKNEVAEIKSKLNCVMNKINYEDNKNKTIEEVTSTYLFIGAAALCMSDQVTFWKNAADKLLTMAKHQNTIHIDHVECLQLEFRKYQPNSRLLRNFNPNVTKEEVDMCTGISEIQEIKDLTRYFDLMSGGFSELTCGSVSYKKALEFAINILLLTTEQDDNEVDLEMKRIATEVNEKVIKMVDCIKGNLDVE